VNIFQQEDVIKGMPDQALMKEAQAPTGTVPQYLVVSEIQRRADMRKRFSGEQQNTPDTTIKEQIVSGGIADIGQQRQAPQGGMMPPQQQMPAGQPMPPQQPMPVPPQPMPQQMPQQAMSNGGVVRMAKGEEIPSYLEGATAEEIAGKLYDHQSGYERQKKPGNPFQYAPGSLSRGDMLRSILGENAYVPSFKESDKIARPKFIESAVQSGRLNQYVPAKDSRLEMMSFSEINQPYKSNYAIDLDASRIESPFATKLTEDLTALGFSETNTQEKVDQDLSKDVYSQQQKAMKDLNIDTSAPDYSARDAQINELQSISGLIKTRDPGDYKSMLEEYTPDFSKLVPDYSSLISDQELKAQKIREDAKKDAGAQALIQLGAGILEGNVGEGLRGAGKAASETMSQARLEASAEERLAHNMRLSAEEARMNLGTLGEQATIAQVDKRNDASLQQYADDRRTQLEGMKMDAEVIKTIIASETAAAEYKFTADIKTKELALEKLVKIASIERFKDLKEEEKQATLRAVMQQIQDPFETWYEEYQKRNKGKNISVEQMTRDINNVINSFLTAYGQKSIPLGNQENSNVPSGTSSSSAGNTDVSWSSM
jgi:hypothetical protein